MKPKHLIYTLVVAVSFFAGTIGCKKSDFAINRNPNSATDSTISYDLILPAALNGTGRVVGRSWGFLQNWLGYWARSGTYAPNVTEETYQITTSFQTGVFTNLYDNLYDYQSMQNSAEKAGANFYSGIARIMKAHNFGLLVDIYNNVPYFEALKGGGNTTPKYSKGIDIYKDLLRQLDTGITLIKGTTAAQNKNIATTDIMFGGNQAMWVKYANTIKLRLLVHLMNGGILKPQELVPGIDIAAEIAKINAEGSGYLRAGENAEVQPGYTADKPNPFYSFYVGDPSDPTPSAQNSVYYKANKYAIDYYSADGDPRLGRFYVAGTQGQRGVQYGAPSLTENAAPTLSGINGPGVARTAASPQRIMTATESLFLQAEAIQRGFIPGGTAAAKAMTYAGITESFVNLGLTAAQATSYIANNAGYADVDYDAPPLGAGLPGGGLNTIIQQKWFALNGIAPYEVWTDYRRVDFNPPTVNHFVYGVGGGFTAGPPISVSPSNTATQIPIRLLYPQTEYNYNPANVGAEGTINQFTSRIFWDLR
jgi:hypothetical protein